MATDSQVKAERRLEEMGYWFEDDEWHAPEEEPILHPPEEEARIIAQIALALKRILMPHQNPSPEMQEVDFDLVKRIARQALGQFTRECVK